MVEIETGVTENTVGAIEQFLQIITETGADPLVIVALLGGVILVGFSITVFGILTIGAIGGSIKRGLSGSEEPNRPA